MHSVDNNNSWINECEKKNPNALKDKAICKIHLCKLNTGFLMTGYAHIMKIFLISHLI